VTADTGSVTVIVTVPTPEVPSPDTCTYAVEAAVRTEELEREVPTTEPSVPSTITKPGPEIDADTVAPVIIELPEFLVSIAAIATCVPIVLLPVIPVSEPEFVEPAPYEAPVPDFTTILVVPPEASLAAATVIETV
jgi:hypothetical protein